MLHTFFVQPKGQRQILEGRLGVYVCDHAADLNNQGYSRNSIQRRARLIADWSQWIQKRSIAVDDLNGDCITRYLRYRYGSKRPDYCDRPALDRFLAWLLEKGIIRRSVPAVIPTQEQQEENAFRRWGRRPSGSVLSGARTTTAGRIGSTHRSRKA